MQITIQPITTGTNGIYKANAINITVLPFDIDDTSIILQCNLVNLPITGGSVQVPDAFGSFQVTIAYPVNMTRVTLKANAIIAILNATSIPFVIR